MTNRFNVGDYGAVANSNAIQTEAFQHCINACRDAGGGEVIVPTGAYIIGSIQLFSNISLILQKSVHLIASLDLKDYSDFGLKSTIAYYDDPDYVKLWHLPRHYFQALIVAHHAENIQIIGANDALIDGRNLQNPEGEEGFRGPMTIVMSQVKRLTLSGYRVKNAANWSHCLDDCQDLNISRIAIIAGHDGFNLHHSQAIRISECKFATGDDCLAGYDIHDLLVDHCYFNTACNVTRIGGTNLKIEHSQITGPGEYPHLSKGTFTTHALFKYYAINADARQDISDQIEFNDCEISQLNRLLDYQYQATIMQSGPELKLLRFVDSRIRDIQQTSLFKSQGVKTTLYFARTTFDVDLPILLAIDAGVTVIFDQCQFVKATQIQLADGTKYKLAGRVTKKFKNNFVSNESSQF
ncbi:glycosyl hydrolase family 28 protein [Lapidilactobacillus bayanensis]|uniref:glycosyl hydrolase family 28 protein n=1 Tax=Lapidilactobacillus bayanensis TaxID=2485998 RepID=UPI000F7A42BF|nr:glycosyl hydrolase family 28 protein [Lapidilactobacillus bayanensis]